MRAERPLYKMQGLRHVAGTHQLIHSKCAVCAAISCTFPHLLFLLASKPLPARELCRQSSAQTCSPACQSENEATTGQENAGKATTSGVLYNPELPSQRKHQRREKKITVKSESQIPLKHPKAVLPGRLILEEQSRKSNETFSLSLLLI